MKLNIFTKHPHSVNETYFQHLKFAFLFGLNMVIAGFACITHAIFPFLFQKTASNILLKAMQDFVDRMPKVEDKMVVLSKSIEKKVERNVEFSTMKNL